MLEPPQHRLVGRALAVGQRSNYLNRTVNCAGENCTRTLQLLNCGSQSLQIDRRESSPDTAPRMVRRHAGASGARSKHLKRRNGPPMSFLVSKLIEIDLKIRGF